MTDKDKGGAVERLLAAAEATAKLPTVTEDDRYFVCGCLAAACMRAAFSEPLVLVLSEAYDRLVTDNTLPDFTALRAVAASEKTELSTKRASLPRTIRTKGLVSNSLLQRVGCVHRGVVVRSEQCKSCRGNVQLSVYACSIYGECTLRKKVDSVSGCCILCSERKPGQLEQPSSWPIAALIGQVVPKGEIGGTPTT